MIQDTDREGLDQKSLLMKIVESTNVLDMLDDAEIARIKTDVAERYSSDRDTMRDWLRGAEKAMRMAMQIKSATTMDRSNIQFPLIAQSCITFNSRAYPTFIKGERIAQPAYFGDRTGDGMTRAKRVAEHMSFTALHGIDGWSENFDKLLQVLPCIGMIYKKTWWDPVRQELRDKLVMPQYITLDNDNSETLETAVVTECYSLNPNEIMEREHNGIFKEGSLDKLLGVDREKEMDKWEDQEVLEQHTWLDLDGDGIFEPYIVYTFKENNEVIGLEPRFSEQDVVVDRDTGDVVDVKATCHFTAYGFIPSFDGTFLHIGFGHLVGPLNSVINTLYNQLIDAGSNANMQSGFIANGLKLGDGPVRLRRNEWMPVNAPSGNVANGILPLPFQEPSAVLFQLLGFTMDMTKNLTATSDIMTGSQDVKNVPATSILAMIEQGMVIMTGIYKRIYRALSKEMQLWQRFYRDNMPAEGRFRYGMGAVFRIQPEDYQQGETPIVPVADPNMSSQLTAIAKARALMDLREMNPDVNMNLITRYYVEALAIENLETDKIVPEDNGETPASKEMARANDLEERKQQMEQAEFRRKGMETLSKMRLEYARMLEAIANANAKDNQTNINDLRAQAERMMGDIQSLDDQIAGSEQPAEEESVNAESQQQGTGPGGEDAAAGVVGGVGQSPDDETGLPDAATGGGGEEPGDVSNLRGPSGRAAPPRSDSQ